MILALGLQPRKRHRKVWVESAIQGHICTFENVRE